MSIKVRLKHSSTLNKAPLPADLDSGELALNINENSPAAYIKDSAGNIVKLAGAGSASTPDATETAKGIVQLADATAITAGTVGRVVDAAQLKAVSDADDWSRTGTALSPANAGDKVGIGTSAPANLLHVKDSDTGGTPHASAQLVVERAGTNYLQLLTTNTETQGVLFGDTGDNDRGKIAYDHGSDDMRFEVAAKERLRVTADGNVGIGTSTPGYPLDVQTYSSGPSKTGAVRFGAGGDNTSTRIVQKTTGGGIPYSEIAGPKDGNGWLACLTHASRTNLRVSGGRVSNA